MKEDKCFECGVIIEGESQYWIHDSGEIEILCGDCYNDLYPLRR